MSRPAVKVVLPLLVVTILIGACTAELPPEELLARAESALSSGEHRAAELDALSVLRQNPNQPQARRILGEIELWRQSPATAVEQFDRALRSNNDADTLALLAEALVRSGDLDKFDSLIFSNYFALAESNPRYLAALARALVARGKLAEAKSTIDRALLGASESLPLRLAAAEIHARQGQDIGKTAAALEEIVAAYPGSASAWAYLGQMHYLDENFPAAIDALATAAGLNPFRIGDKMLLGSALLKSGDLVQARNSIEALAAIAPNHPGVDLLMAELQFREQNIDEAVASINKVLNATPRQPAALYMAGLINGAAGNLESARRNLLAFLSMQPEQLEVRLRLAAVSLELQDAESAAAAARTVLEKQPMNISATRILATALALLGDQAASLEAFGRAMELDPDSAITAASFSRELARSGDMEGAIEQLRAARELDPESFEARSTLATALLASGDSAQAISEASDYVQSFPDDPRAHNLAGTVAYNAGSADNAREHFEQAEKFDKGNVAANTGLASIAIEEGDRERAQTYYQHILNTHPDHLQTLLRMAMLSEVSGNLGVMESRLQQAMKAHPDALEPRVALSRYRFTQQRYRDAITLLTDVRENYAGDPVLHDLLAKAYLRLGEYSSARSEAQKLVELFPESAEILSLRAQAEFGLGLLAKTEDTLRAAARLSDSPQVTVQLINVLLQAGKFEAANEALEGLPPGALSPWRYEFARGRIAESTGDDGAAAEAYARAMQAEPRTTTLVAWSNALWRTGEQAAAFAELYKWLEENPNDVIALNHLGNLHMSSNEDKAAFLQFERLNMLQPGNPQTLNNLAWTGRKSNPQLSLERVRRALELAPDNANIEDTYAMALLANGDGDEALKVNSRLLEPNPEQPYLLLHRAEILAALNRNDDARAILDTLIAEGAVVEQARSLRAGLR